MHFHCNTCVAVALFFIFRIVEFIYALRGDWQDHQPACIMRAYCLLTLCAAFCYSYSIQAISRLFFTIFYKYKYLLTWRSHWILIILNWLISIIIPIKPLFYHNGFGLEEETRNFIVTPKVLSIFMYLMVIMFIIPLNIVTIIYGIILYHVRQSTRRVVVFVPNTIRNAVHAQNPSPNGKRELKLMQTMSIQTTIISFGGILYMICVIWYGTQQQPPPESIHLLAVNLISIFTVFMMITLFVMNKKVKDIALSYVF